MVPYAVQHVPSLEIPDDNSADCLRGHLLARGQKCARFRNRDLADATFVPLEISVDFLLDALDDDGAADGPDEVHVARVDHHAVLVGRVEAN